MEKATFGAGCFWHVEEVFGKIKGVISTSVGYMGGKLKNPTYKEVCTDKTGHAEVVHLEYNPNKVGYKWPDCLNPDDDGDGLPDWWENKYFGSDTAANPDEDVDVDEAGQPAPDGYLNIDEYQNGTDPTKPQYSMFELNLYDLADVIITGSYLPEYRKTVKVRARWLTPARRPRDGCRGVFAGSDSCTTTTTSWPLLAAPARPPVAQRRG